LPIRQRVQYKLCTLVHRCLYGEAPFYLAELVVPTSIASNRAGLRSAQSLSIAVPRTYSALGDRAFSVVYAAKSCDCEWFWRSTEEGSYWKSEHHKTCM